MKVKGLRSPHAKVGGLFYFGRMLDKIRLHAQGKLPSDYHENLGGGFDARCIAFLNLAYPELVERVQQGGTDEEILDWCLSRGPRPSLEQIEVWNEFMRKRGWNDEASERLKMRKKELGSEDRKDVQTFFDFIDLDEQ